MIQITELIKKANNILIVCHKKPDGDCFGSGFALWHLARFYKKNAEIIVDSPPPAAFEFLPGYEKLNIQSRTQYDLVIAVDCAESDRMGKFADYSKNSLSVNIDHHKTNEYFCKINYVVPELSSTCEIVFDLLKSDGVFEEGALDKDTQKNIALCLFTGLSTDTGHFMHNTANAKTFRTAAALIETGLDPSLIATNIYRANSIQKSKLIARAIESFRFFNNGEICIMSISLNDFEELGCVQSDTEGLIDHAMNIKCVKVAVGVVESNPRQFRVSLRSKGADVSKAAGVFGGGGHTRAAGCLLHGQFEDVKDKLIKAVSDVL